MFCLKCGSKIHEDDKYCVACGSHVVKSKDSNSVIIEQTKGLDTKWWLRLLKVIYIFLYAQILWIVPVAWSINSSRYDYTYGYQDTYSEAFWYSLLTLIIYVVVLRLIKVAVLYVVAGQRPVWTEEFKKLF